MSVLPQLTIGLQIDKLCGVVLSHNHQDHSKAREDFEKWFIPCYSTDNLECGKPIMIGSYKVLPMRAYHNIECYAYWIRDTINNKNIIFATDTTEIPKVVDKEFDCMMLEANYSLTKINELIAEGKEVAQGYQNHCSIETLAEWLKNRQHNTNKLVLIHRSRRNYFDTTKAINELKEYVGNVIIAEPNTIIEI